MITLIDFAETLSTGLNAILNEENLQFKIWANAGEMTKAIRNGNTVQQWIHGVLQSESSTNENNILAMGANNLSLTFAVPLKPPKTISTQTAAQLEKISDSQYPFVDYITSVIDNYFSVSSVFEEQDASGTSFTITMSAGRTTDGIVDIMPQLDECVIINLYISATFLEGGINARNIILNIDDIRMPFQNLTIGRANRLTSDVYSTSADVKNLSSASALSFDFAFPANSDNTTQQAFLSLLGGQNNCAHFVELSMGSAYDGIYLMLFENLQLSAEGVYFAGISGSLIEAADNPLLLDFPEYMQVNTISFNNSDVIFSINFRILKTYPQGFDYPNTISTLIYIAGQAQKIESLAAPDIQENDDGTITVSYFFGIPSSSLSPTSSLIYNATTQKYDFYIITNENITNLNYTIV